MKFKSSPDFIVLAAAALVFLGVLGWIIGAQISARGIGAAPSALIAGELAFAPLAATGAAQKETTWSPLPESDDAEVWSFDVFTPPRIFFDPATGRFSISVPEATEIDSDPLDSPFGISLIEVERQPFRLQLVGYAGESGDPWGIFANEVSGEGIVAQPGFRFADLDLELQQLEIKREDFIVPESMPLREIVAVALLRDQRDQRTVRLTSGYPAWTDRPTATVVMESSGEQREVQAGSRIELGQSIIEITGVFTGPDSVTAVKLLPDGTRETIRLTPVNSSPAQFESDTIF